MTDRRVGGVDLLAEYAGDGDVEVGGLGLLVEFVGNVDVEVGGVGLHVEYVGDGDVEVGGLGLQVEYGPSAPTEVALTGSANGTATITAALGKLLTLTGSANGAGTITAALSKLPPPYLIQMVGQLGNPDASLGIFQLGTPPIPEAPPVPGDWTGVGHITAPKGFFQATGFCLGPVPAPPEEPHRGGAKLGERPRPLVPQPVFIDARVRAPLGTFEAHTGVIQPVVARGTVTAPRPHTESEATVLQPVEIVAAVRAPVGRLGGHGWPIFALDIRTTAPRPKTRGVGDWQTPHVGRAAITHKHAVPAPVVSRYSENEALWAIGLGDLIENPEDELALV